MDTLFDLPDKNKKHPAKYSDILIPVFVEMLRGRKRVLDPFGGTGRIFEISHWIPDIEIEALEIEPEWAEINPRTTLGNALDIPWSGGYFDAVCTSPTYGNRMADRLSTGKWKRISYADELGRDLSSDNSGSMQWGDEYREFHRKAWVESKRVLESGGIFILNIKDHIRNYKVQPVTEWHIGALEDIGFEVVEWRKVDCPGMRYGDNYELRVEFESVIKFVLHK